MEGILKIFDITPIDLNMIIAVGVLFVILWQVLDKSLFAPYLNLIDAREQATIGVEEEAQKAYVKAEVGSRDYEAKVAEARKNAMQKKLVAMDDAKKRAEAILNTAKEQAAQITAESKAKVWADAESSRREALSQAEGLAVDMVAKLKVAPTPLQKTLN